LTLFSRVLGFLRDMLSAAIFGTGIVYDAFLLAFIIPNLFRKLLAEGALSAAFIPVYADYIKQGDREKSARFLSSVFTVLFVVLAAIAIAGAIAGSGLGFGISAPGKWKLTFHLFPVMIIYVIPICLVGLAAGILNSHNHFAMPAFAPVMLNVLWIAGLSVAWLLSGEISTMIIILALTVVLAGFVQFLLQVPVMKRRGVSLRLMPVKTALKHPGVRQVEKLWLPVAFGLAIFQVNTLGDSLIAMIFVKDGGGVSVLYYANRMIQFPLALIGIAVATALFPTLSRLLSEGKIKKFALTFNESMLGVMFVTIPAAVGLAVLSTPVIRLIFERGKFDAFSTSRTSLTLVFYCATIVSGSVFHLLTRAFYSLKDTRTPVKIGAIVVALNVLLNLILVWPLQEAGLALATSITSVINSVALLLILKKRAPDIDTRGIIRGFIIFCLVAAVMGAAVYGCLHLLPGNGRIFSKLISVFIPILAGIIIVFVLSLLLRLPELKFMLGAIRRRRKS